jgi:hypothetical protein
MQKGARFSNLSACEIYFMKTRAIVALGFASLLTSQLAFADDPTKQQCVDADTQAQSLRSDGKLSATREQLLICANAACPQVVRDDCAQRIDEINRVQPTIVFSAKNGAGQDLVNVKVTVDGKPLADKLDGHPLTVDPGDHTFVFETPGEAPITQHFVLAESEKNRREAITIGKPPAVPLTDHPGGNEANLGSGDPNAGKTQRILGLGAAGVGVVGAAVGAVFGLLASSNWSSAQSDCPSAVSCKQPQAGNERSSALTDSTVSTIAFMGGGVLIAGGAVLFFTAPKPNNAVTVGVAPTLGGAVLSGTF